MDKMVQQNAANPEESASASEAMNAQAEQMTIFAGELESLAGGTEKRVEHGVKAALGVIRWHQVQECPVVSFSKKAFMYWECQSDRCCKGNKNSKNHFPKATK